MIVNNPHNYPQVIDQLNVSSFEFYLTGSRYWDTWTKQSDWDFFVQHSDDVIAFLTSLGFKRDSTSDSYKDNINCVDVYNNRKRDGEKVEIQLVKSAVQKQVIQENLIKMYPCGFRDKIHARRVWKDAFTLFDAGMKYNV